MSRTTDVLNLKEASVTHTPPKDEYHEPPPRRASFLRVAGLTVLALAGFAGLGVFGLQARARQTMARERTEAARPERPRVLTAKAEKAPAEIDQVLPGTAVPYRETAVYARTSGYLKRWLVDIGDSVTEGQLLAEIETPEVDAQLAQARAALGESRATVERNRANEALAKTNLRRLTGLHTGAASQLELDQADAALKVAAATVRVSEATIAANEANVKRLEELQGYQKVTAPFAGVVTARNYDPGALIVADNAAARELFHLSQVETLRVIADVPQTFAPAVRSGKPAPVFRREAPQQEYAGTIARTTRSVSTQTRTLRVEVEVPNRDGALLPGMYLQVRFKLTSPSGVVRVPGAAVVTRSDGAKVAVVDAGGAVRYRPVTLGRDFGATVEVVGGLQGGETLVVRPGDDLPDGTAVEPVSPARGG